MSGGPASNSGVPEPPAFSPAAAAPSSAGQNLRPRRPTSMAEDEPTLEPHSSPNPATTPQATMHKDAPGSADDGLVPKIGMIFESVDDAFQFYKAYGYRTGFGVTKRSSHNFDGIRYRSTFTCCKGGKAKVKPGNKSRRKPVVRTECKAMMVIKDQHFQNRWVVDDLILEHNHPLDPDMVRFMKCFREFPSSVKRKLQINDDAGMPLDNSTTAVSSQGVRNENGSFTKRFCRNHLDKTKKLKLADGDAEALMEFFENLQAQNSNFFHSWDWNDEGCLRNVFWADIRARAAYQYFSDVITFDTMYLTDEYEILFASFVGVNHHGQSVLLGCGLLADETMETYIWLFMKWLTCMNDKPPNAIITDHCKAIAGAVAEVFPHARHRFCHWHIMKKLPEKLGRMKEAISSKMSKAVYDSLTVNDFESEWKEMIEQYHLQDNEWLSSLYEDRRKWVPAYIKDTFWADMSTSQRGKSMKSFFDGHVTSKTSLKMFLKQYDNTLKGKFEKEAQEDFRSFHTSPQLLSGLEFEKQIAKVYTMNIFLKFQDEVKQLMQCNTNLVDRSGPAATYMVTELTAGRKVDYKVVYNPDEEDVWCICRSFQFRGILCRHALCVLRQELVMVLPCKYVLARWRKDFKRLHISASSPHIASMREMRIYDDLYMRAHQYFVDIVEIGATDHDLKEFALTVLKESRDKVIKYAESRSDRRIDDNTPTERPASRKEKAVHNSKKKKNKGPNKEKSTNLGQVQNTRNTIDTSTSVHVQANHPNEAWPMTPIGGPESFGHRVESIPMDWLLHNPAPYTQWRGNCSFYPSRRM
ncbi:protein FAR1-RELATED SEQUENCE 6-like [Phoenix dactylifera]|uniref:Protein FAR1-RELATED SEQUENCE n=1 Tax=Phoenix dactylifera TaxID=42345 RepID=A0A8B7BE08_PHODC|nr:protein FAR1-RELATED SEQUENCE 6-like [Phoenix dactylifera]